MTSLLAGLLFLVCSSEAAPGPVSWRGDEVLPGCREYVVQETKGRPSFLAGLCSGVVAGVMIANEEFQSYKICAANLTLKQAVESVIAYLEKNPSHQYNNFDETVIHSLSKSHPCPNVNYP